MSKVQKVTLFRDEALVLHPNDQFCSGGSESILKESNQKICLALMLNT